MWAKQRSCAQLSTQDALWLVFQGLSGVLTQLFCGFGLICILFTIHLNNQLHVQRSSLVMITHSISSKQQRIMFVIFFFQSLFPGGF